VEALFDGAVEGLDLGSGVARALWVEVDDVAVGGVEFEVGVLKLAEALREEPRADDEHERKRGCRTTRMRCSMEAPEAVVREVLRSASAGSARAAIHAGATPKSTPVMSERTKAKPMTMTEGDASMGTLVAPGKASASSMWVPT